MRRRSTGIAAIILLIVFGVGCGETFRPIATPITQPGGDPNVLQHAIVVQQNGLSQGSATSVDTTGDTNVGNAIVGVGPVHAGFVSGLRTYTANQGDNTVTRFLTLTPNAGNVTIPMPAGCNPSFVMSRNNGTAYVACPGSNQVAVMNVALDSIVTAVTVGASPQRLDETFNGNKLYSLNSGDGTVSVIATLDNVVSKTITVGGSPTWSALNQDGSLLFVANASGYVSVIDTITDALALPPVAPANTITVGANPTFVTFDTNRRRLYVVNNGDSTISVIDAVATSPTFMTVIATIPVGADPRSITALKNGAKAYVSNCGSDTVSVIDAISLAVVKTINTGTCPIWLTSPTDSSRVIVGVQGAGTGTNFADPPQILTISTQTDAILVTLKPPQQVAICNPATAPNNYCALQQPVFVTMAP
jgi:YVTN family beta-propeller protein